MKLFQIAILAAGILATTSAFAARPNIILIMCDDMGFSDIGCYGGEINTPNINSLAKDGLRFKQFYNNAKCTTTRASLVTGLYPRPTGGLLKPNMVTIADVLGAAGYQTALSGKWHLGSKSPNRPGDRGFDEYYGLLDGCCNFFNPAQPDPKFKGGRVRWFGKNDERILDFPEDFYATDAFSDYAVDVLDRFSKDKDRPFFLHVCYTAPHYPLHAKPVDIAKYKGKYLIGWDELRRQRRQRQIDMGLFSGEWPITKRDPEAGDWADARDKQWQDLRMATYAAMIDSMDQGIGRILNALEERKLTENTLVMFLSDNGGCAETPGGNDTSRIPGPKEFYTHCGPAWAYAQNTPFRRYKQYVHEGGISTPFIVRWPARVKANTMTNEVGHIIDVMATCADVGETVYPRRHDGNDVIPLDGKSLRMVFAGGTREPHETLYWEWAGNRAIRRGDWKLSWDRKIGEWELYNLITDRTETRDLATQHPDKVKAMGKAWLDWAKRTGNRIGPKARKKKAA
jgi:arylsulfatase A-like enzyme